MAAVQPEKVICSKITDTDSREKTINDDMDTSVHEQ